MRSTGGHSILDLGKRDSTGWIYKDGSVADGNLPSSTYFNFSCPAEPKSTITAKMAGTQGQGIGAQEMLEMGKFNFLYLSRL